MLTRPLTKSLTQALTSSLAFDTGGGGGNPSTITQSLDFDAGTTDFLNMSNANFGSYNRQKFSIFGAIKREASGGIILSRTGSFASGNRELSLDLAFSTNKLSLRDPSGAWRITSAGTLDLNTWYAFLVHYDSAQATSADRLKMWLNGTLETPSASYPSLNESVATGTADTKIGTWDNTGGGNSDFYTGKVFSLGMISGELLDPSQWFLGTAGEVQDVKAQTGLKFLLDVDGGNVTSDYVLAAAWTNNNSVSADSDIP